MQKKLSQLQQPGQLLHLILRIRHWHYWPMFEETMVATRKSWYKTPHVNAQVTEIVGPSVCRLAEDRPSQRRKLEQSSTHTNASQIQCSGLIFQMFVSIEQSQLELPLLIVSRVFLDFMSSVFLSGGCCLL